MTRVFSWIQNVIVRRITVVFLLGLAFLGIQAFGYNNGILAQADVRSPEGIYYKGTPDNSGNSGNVSNDKNLFEKALDNLNPNTDNNPRRNFDSDRQFSSNTGNSGNSGNIGNTVKSPEGIYYKGTPDYEGNQSIRNDNQVENAQNNLKQTANNVREKLNLDEETPRATKEFIQSVKSKVGEVVNPSGANR
ncbi:MAG: hypothetical protein KME32_20485 [Mojavia pulchra JT2-VF2]|jgi:hypothetical protein|uniref:Uncharacterized protein n=1 Tax=Mojavia pulchra JT2-VF2 TaxID=287848 RepID=A0A951Q363_9NOST|nr:hypothetical protein [Mojavia pulchra JT2-VF2]